ncbi:hypothetical protein SS1G_11982 [Sclerotinia sclerotiorum 1980 UF-70]|uniref:Uncharacterized protein n=1 Tax=Sclerotinia sclerotiorum (strain ATCC 18683 / 1980 / Ss-1) TaxID=665079 RepID=A7F3Y6_SCLS1|nr:hypothetical protein SS1G_11982 [Sclerotinia sclerotiorum 1980 UF-70]EDN97457.1 hypothetical protein SS1G_11982 [Sclerotinia sclerotiorum 1980 UF-70]
MARQKEVIFIPPMILLYRFGQFGQFGQFRQSPQCQISLHFICYSSYLNTRVSQILGCTQFGINQTGTIRDPTLRSRPLIKLLLFSGWNYRKMEQNFNGSKIRNLGTCKKFLQQSSMKTKSTSSVKENPPPANVCLIFRICVFGVGRYEVPCRGCLKSTETHISAINWDLPDCRCAT